MNKRQRTVLLSSLVVGTLAASGAWAQSTPADSSSPAPAATQPTTQPAPAAGADAMPGHGHRFRHHHDRHGFMGLKSDADGSVSRTELQDRQARQLAMFDKVDANHDGKLSPDEIKAARQAMREARKSRPAS